MTHRLYAKAPIVEAIIDVQTRFNEPPKLERFEACQERLADRFPIKAPLHLVQMGMSNVGEQEGGWQSQFEQSQVGLRLSSENNDRVLQLQQRGFTYSHMPPYTQWNTFGGEAKKLWAEFVDTCEPEAVIRCAVRFINRINIPKEIIELSDYFNLYPNIPRGIPQDVNGMFLQLQMPQTDLMPEAVAVINLALTEPEVPGHATVLLDFDLFRIAELDPRSDDIWVALDQFRLRKNQLFEACITDETRRLIS